MSMLSTLIHKYNWALIKPLLIETWLYLLVGVVVFAVLLYVAKKVLKVKTKWSMTFVILLLLSQYFWCKHNSTQDILNGKLPMSTQIGVIDQAAQQIKGDGKHGFLAYGPYMPLVQGTYKVTFRIRLENLNNQGVGFCDVNVLEHPESYVRKELVLEGFKKHNPQDVSLVFTIPEGKPKAEFRVFQYGGNTLTLTELRLAPGGIREIILKNKDYLFKSAIYIFGALIFIAIYLKFLSRLKETKVRKILGVTSIIAVIFGFIMALVWHWKGFSNYSFVQYYDMWRVFYAPAWLPLLFIFFNFLYLINGHWGFDKDAEKYLKYDRYTLLILPAFIITELLVKNINTHMLLGNFYLGTLAIKSIIYFIFLWQNIKEQQDIQSNKGVKRTIFFSIFTVYMLITPWVNAAFYTDGDESRILLKAQSIVLDSDFDVTNNVDNIDNFAYHPDARWTLWWGLGTNSGHPILLTPGFILGGRFGATLIMNLFGAFLTLNLFLLIYHFTKSVSPSFLAALMASFTCPLGVYTLLLYPEIIAAAAGPYLLRKLIELKNRREIINILTIIISAVFLIFLKERYVIILAVILIALIYKIRKNIKYILIALGLTTLAIVLFIAFDKITWNLNQTHRIVGSFFRIPARFSRITAGIVGSTGLLLDQETGLLVYNPLYMLAFLGLTVGLIIKATRRKAFLILALFLPYYLVIGFNEEWEITGALAPRYIIAVIPVLAVALGLFLHHCRRFWFKIITIMAAFWASCFYYILLLIPQYRVHSPNALTGRNELLDRLYAARFLPNMTIILPSMLRPASYNNLILIVYVVLFILLLINYLRQYSATAELLTNNSLRRRKSVLLLLGILFAVLLVFYSWGYRNYQELYATDCYVGGSTVRVNAVYNDVMLNGEGFFVLAKTALRKGEEINIQVTARADYYNGWPRLIIDTGTDQAHEKVGEFTIDSDRWQTYEVHFRAKNGALCPFWFINQGFAKGRSIYLKKIVFRGLRKNNK